MIYAGLCFYDSLSKTDYHRTRARLPVLSPRNQLPPFQLNAGNIVADLTNVFLEWGDVSIEITSCFAKLPEKVAVGSDFYLMYDGSVMDIPLPVGRWHVKLVFTENQSDIILYYSDVIIITDIYPNLLTGWSNSGGVRPYDIFTSIQAKITEAKAHNSGSYCESSPIPVKQGEKYVIQFFAVMSSSSLEITAGYESGDPIFEDVSVTNGINSFSFTAGKNGSVIVSLHGWDEIEFSTSDVYVTRNYNSRFMRLDFSNTDDLGNILYDNWHQSLWLETRLNYPLHETIKVGEELDGLFIPEKIITKYVYRISTYVPRSVALALTRLPQHDNITITDEVGNTYSPDIGNIDIEIEWLAFETAHIVIMFNDGGSVSWTHDMNNLT